MKKKDKAKSIAKMQRYHFPTHQLTVEASSKEDAEKKLEKLINKK